MQQTSLIAYDEIKRSLGLRHLQVLKAIEDLKEANNLMISQYLQIPINSVTPRTNELLKMGKVKVYKVGTCPISHRKTMFYCLKESNGNWK